MWDSNVPCQLCRSNTMRQAGFTLIELLVAMTLSALIAVMSYQAIHQVVTVKEQTDASVQRFNDLQRAVWWLEQDLTQMAPRPILDRLGDPLPALMAKPYQAVEWTRIAVAPSPYGSAGLLRVSYALQDHKLYRLIWPVLDRAQDSEPKKWLLLDGVSQFQIRFMNAKHQWQTRWPENAQSNTDLPVMSEFTLTVDGLGKMRRLLPGVDGLSVPTQQPPAGSQP